MKKRIHVAHFTNTYYPIISGVVRSVSSFREALTALGHNVFIFAQENSDYEDQEPFIFRYPATLDLPLSSKFPLTIPVFPWQDDLLTALKLDVIHSHHPFLLGQVAARKAEDFNLPLVFTYHTRYREYSHYLPLEQDFVKRAIDRWMGDYMRRCQHIVVPSESIKRVVAEDYGIADRVTVVSTGVNLKPFQQADSQSIRQALGWGNDTVLISIGRLAKEKNWETLLNAVVPVLKARDDVRLVLIGEGDQRKALETQAKKSGVAGRVSFTGKVRFQDVPAYLKAADLFCFASITETQGLVTMEALAAGLPVVAVDASGTRDVINSGQEGLLTTNDSAALAQALETILDNPDLAQRFRENALKKARSLDSVHQAEKMVEVYAQAVEDKKANFSIKVDEQKGIFKFSVDEGWWRRLRDFMRDPHLSISEKTE